jgi:hypothetical protein
MLTKWVLLSAAFLIAAPVLAAGTTSSGSSATSSSGGHVSGSSAGGGGGHGAGNFGAHGAASSTHAAAASHTQTLAAQAKHTSAGQASAANKIAPHKPIIAPTLLRREAVPSYGWIQTCSQATAPELSVCDRPAKSASDAAR